jgi:predicted nucleic acid-binding protein
MLTMSEILLLDSGVWIATVDETDRFAAASRELVLRTSRQAAALDLTLYEIANVVGSRWKRQEKARLLCRSVQLQCEEAMVRVDADLIVSTIELSVDYGLSGYDAAYVAAARRGNWTLVSTDIRDLVSRGLAITPDAAV